VEELKLIQGSEKTAQTIIPEARFWTIHPPGTEVSFASYPKPDQYPPRRIDG
jgi:hypothetical protein